MRNKGFLVTVFVTACAGLPQQAWSQNTTTTSQQTKYCVVPREEIEVLTAFLKPEDGSPKVLVTKTDYSHADVDYLNLQLAAKGRGIPPEVRTDFKEKNRLSCLIQPFAGIGGLQFISKREKDLMFRVPKGCSKFHKKYGKEAEMLWVSRIGFNAEKTLALIHISGAMGSMAGSGTLNLLELKERKWVVKAQIETWTT